MKNKQELKKFILIGIWIIPFSLLLCYFLSDIITFFFGKKVSFTITTAHWCIKKLPKQFRGLVTTIQVTTVHREHIIM